MTRSTRIKIYKTKRWIRRQDWLLIVVSMLLGIALFFALGLAGASDLEACIKGEVC